MSREFPSPDFALREEIDAALAQQVDYEAWSSELKTAHSEYERNRGFGLLRFQLTIATFLSFFAVGWDMFAVPQMAGISIGWRLVATVPLALYGLLVLDRGAIQRLKLVLGLSLVSLGVISMQLAAFGSAEIMARYAMATSFLLGLACLAIPYSPRELRIFILSFLITTSLAAMWPSPLPPKHLVTHIAFTALVCLPSLAIARRHWQLNSRAFLLDLRDDLIRHELEQNNELLRQLSEQDPLTGMPNRRQFERVVTDRLATRITPVASSSNMAVMMIDLDHFKAFNDRHGHQAGDRCLMLAAAQLQAVFPREYGILARYGGEEFIAALREREPGEAARLAEDLRAAIAAMLVPVRDQAKPLITTSIGLALAPVEAGLALEDLIEMADAALYSAKRSGRNRVELVEAGMPLPLNHAELSERRRG